MFQLGLPLDAEILDVACGTGVVAEECRVAGYTQVLYTSAVQVGPVQETVVPARQSDFLRSLCVLDNFFNIFFGVQSNLEHPEIIFEFQIDGLDPCQGYLEGGISRGIFRKVFREFIDPEKQTSIPDSTYDALLCCAGFFQVIQPLSIMV